MTSNLFIPTYLYIKQHSVTRKLYFGKTSKDPETYSGSGKHWKNHIKIHGKQYIITLWYCLFLDQESCTEFALNFSEQQSIVESSDWLNLKPENGLDGGGIIHTNETRNKISNSLKGHVISNLTKQKISKSLTGKSNISCIGKSLSPEHKYKISSALQGCERDIKAIEKQRKTICGFVWWNNGHTQAKALKAPAINWVRGMLPRN